MDIKKVMINEKINRINSSKDLKIKIFADGANLDEMKKLASLEWIKGLTTNPTLMAKAGIKNYENFAKSILEIISDKPISFEVFSDDHDEMEKQARIIAGWAENVYVKIPVTNTKGVFSGPMISKLVSDGIKLNVTAIFTMDQVKKVCDSLDGNIPSNVSVFAGRIADAGLDPIPIMKESLNILNDLGASELIWASPREVFNIVQADQINCDIITVTASLLNKLPNIGKDLEEFSLDTVKMFYNDAFQSGYSI